MHRSRNMGCFFASMAVAIMAASAIPAKAAQLTDKVEGRFRAIFEDRCATAGSDSHIEAQPPEIHEIRFKNAYQSDGSEQIVTLFAMLCDRGAYNETHVFMLANEHGEILPLQFAEPALKISYENDDFEAAVQSVEVHGMSASDMLVNAFYDPKSRSITSHSKWRGLGDASSIGLWQFKEGRFLLARYEVDPSYDGEITMQTVVDYTSLP